ncbi:SFH1 [Symbiodinium natans]|uniref:SFH1 protein n=1 Tax=Symbiodinium natans TaxID=878477 RepID=A0A812S4L3_9DINO|nr:SFH1 [Symbiodinium natans]
MKMRVCSLSWIIAGFMVVWQARWFRPLAFAHSEAYISPSCQAAALGSNPGEDDLAKCKRSLPVYMLKAARGDRRQALQRWAQTLRWRCQIDDDGIVSRPNPNYFRIQPHYPTYLHLPDKEGRTTYWELLGRIDMAGLHREGITVDDIRENYVWQTLFTWDVWLKRDGAAEGTIIVDMQGFSLSMLTPRLIQMFVRTSSLIQRHFPEREHVLIVINAPEWWGRMYDLFGPLFPESQRQKLRVCVDKDKSLQTLTEFIDVRNIPRVYGGTGDPLGSAPADVLKRKLAAKGMQPSRKP